MRTGPACELMLEHLTQQGVTGRLELVLVDRGTTTESLAAPCGRLTPVPRLHPDGPGQEPTATSLHEEALGRNQHKTTRKVGWRLEGNQGLPPRKGGGQGKPVSPE